MHELTPPDVLTPVIRKISQEFVHPGVGSEVIAAGINAVREVCRRQPWCMEEDLLSDLIEYRKSKDKGVVTASRGLLQLFREVNPGLLKKRERGKAAAMGETTDMQAPQYGHTSGPQGIEGLELLEKHFAAMRKEANGGESDDEAGSNEEFNYEEGEDEGGWDDWEMDSDADSDSSGWENVSSDGEEFELSDSEDEDGEKKKKSKPATEDNNKVKRKRLLGKRKRNKGDTGSDDSDEGSDADSEADEADETRSVVSAAPTDISQTTKKLSLLAQQKILTPADFALLNELKLKAAQDLAANGGGSAAKRKLAALEAAKKSHGAAAGDDMEGRFLTENEILGPRKKTKMDYEERMESIKKGREGREKFGSNKGKQNKEAKSSSTNREKNKNKPIMMALQYVPLSYSSDSAQGEVTDDTARTVWSARKRRLCATSRSSCARLSTSAKSQRDDHFERARMWFLDLGRSLVGHVSLCIIGVCSGSI